MPSFITKYISPHSDFFQNKALEYTRYLDAKINPHSSAFQYSVGASIGIILTSVLQLPPALTISATAFLYGAEKGYIPFIPKKFPTKLLNNVLYKYNNYVTQDYGASKTIEFRQANLLEKQYAIFKNNQKGVCLGLVVAWYDFYRFKIDSDFLKAINSDERLLDIKSVQETGSTVAKETDDKLCIHSQDFKILKFKSPEEQLEKSIKKIANAAVNAVCNNPKELFIIKPFYSDAGHAIGIFSENKKIYLFDPNYRISTFIETYYAKKSIQLLLRHGYTNRFFRNADKTINCDLIKPALKIWNKKAS